MTDVAMVLDDFSCMNPTSLRDITAAGSLLRASPLALPPTDTTLAPLRHSLTQAQTSAGLCIGGARHSMGGQTLLSGGVHWAMRDDSARVSGVQSARYWSDAGSTWAQVIASLDTDMHAVQVMQSNNDFSVGGSLSVNAHGWQTRRGPIGQTCVSLLVMLSSGEVVHCSRTQNADLFGAVVGGYGLCGIILAAELEAAPNCMLKGHWRECSAAEYRALWRERAADRAGTQLSYGRIALTGRRAFEKLSFSWFEKTDEPPEPLAPHAETHLETLARTVFRGSVGNDYGKRLRWDLERWTGGGVAGTHSRNAVMNHSSKFFTNNDPARSELLHESFLPHDAFEAFVAELRRIVPRHRDVDCLNITIRDICADTSSMLAYARQDVFAFVLLLNIARNPSGDQALGRMQRELIDATLALGGSFYLPYRCHATGDQLARAYPKLDVFRAQRERFDPKRILKNKFSEAYRL